MIDPASSPLHVVPQKPATARSGRRRRRVLAVLGVLTLALLAASVVLFAWVRSDAGRAFVARQLESTISSQIRGHLTIARVDSVDLHRVAAHGVRFEDESGRAVLEADEAELAYDLGELLHGHFVSRAGSARGGRVTLETNAAGDLLIDRAFRSAHMGAPGAPVGDDVVHLENLEVQDVTVVVHLGSAPVATLRGVGGMLLVRAPDHGAAIVEADHVHGGLHVASPVPFDLRAIAGSLDVDGAARRRVHLDLPSRMGTERIGVEVTATVQPDESFFVDARIRPHGLSAMFAATSMISQALLAETQTDALDVTVELQ